MELWIRLWKRAKFTCGGLAKWYVCDPESVSLSSCYRFGIALTRYPEEN